MQAEPELVQLDFQPHRPWRKSGRTQLSLWRIKLKKKNLQPRDLQACDDSQLPLIFQALIQLRIPQNAVTTTSTNNRPSKCFQNTNPVQRHPYQTPMTVRKQKLRCKVFRLTAISKAPPQNCDYRGAIPGVDCNSPGYHIENTKIPRALWIKEGVYPLIIWEKHENKKKTMKIYLYILRA